MLAMSAVQSAEVSSVQCEDCPPVRRREFEYRGIGKSLTSKAGLLHIKNVMAKPPELHDDWPGEVLIGEEPRHPLRRFVLLDLARDLVAVPTHVGPCVDQILGS
jgi:hypothetical protein